MSQQEQPSRIRFESFDLDLHTRELRKNGRPVKLQDQPGKLLSLLASRAGELVTRTDIEKALWGDDEFVEFEHAINTAIRKIREALEEDLEKPRFIETLPRKGYRFIAPVEVQTRTGTGNHPQQEAGSPARNLRDKIRVHSNSTEDSPPAEVGDPPLDKLGTGVVSEVERPGSPLPANPSPVPIAATTAADFSLPRSLAWSLFLAIQAGYLAIYCAVLYKADSMEEVLATVLAGPGSLATPVVLVSAMCGIAIRLYLIASVGLDHPAAGEKYRRLFPALFVFDTLWAMSPLLLVRKLGYGLALGAIAAFTYLPFAQRTLIQFVYPASKSAGDRNSRLG